MILCFWVSVDELVYSSWLRVDTQCLGDFQVHPLRTGRLAHMQGMAVRALKHRGHPYLAR